MSTIQSLPTDIRYKSQYETKASATDDLTGYVSGQRCGDSFSSKATRLHKKLRVEGTITEDENRGTEKDLFFSRKSQNRRWEGQADNETDTKIRGGGEIKWNLVRQQEKGMRAESVSCFFSKS